MLQGPWDPYSSTDVAGARSPYERTKMEFTNMYCRRQRVGRDAATPTGVLKRRAEEAWSNSYRGGTVKKRRVRRDAQQDLDKYMEPLESGMPERCCAVFCVPVSCA